MLFRSLVVAVTLAACSSWALAQSAARLPRIAYLGFLGEPATDAPLRDGFMRGLRELGYAPGKNVVVDVRRYASSEQLREALKEALRARPDVIVVGPPFAASAARVLTKEIPIVCSSCGDPVENGLAASLSRPGGNVTGLASLSAELIAKRIGLVKDLFPGTPRVAVIVFPANPGTPPTLKALDAAARDQGLEIQRFEVRSIEDFDKAFAGAAAGGAHAVVLQDDPILRSARDRIVALSLRHRLPVSTGLPELVDAGIFMGYGPDRADMARRAAAFADKILKGARPADMPFEQAGKLDLVINLKSAKVLGIKVPQPVLMRADRLVE